MTVKGKEVATDAAGGAIAGSVFGPEGTVIGGALGAGYGVLSGALSGPQIAPSNANNFTFGTNQGSIAQPGVKIAQGYDQQAQQYRQQSNRYGNQAGDAFGYGQAAQSRQAGQVEQNPYDRRAQLAALQATNGTAGQLNALGTAPMGPSVAAAQLQQGQDAAARQSLAMASSGRTIGGGAAAMQGAQFANAQGQQQTNQAAAVARLQEQQQYRQMQLGALGASQQGYGMAGQQAAGINAANIGMQGQNIGFQQQQQAVNNQTLGAYGQIGTSLNNTGTQRAQLGQGYDQMGFNTLGASLGASEQYQNSLNGNSIAQAGIDQNTRAANTALLSSAAGAAADYYGNQNTASDRDVKQNIMPAGAAVDPRTATQQWQTDASGNVFDPSVTRPYDARMAAAQNQASLNGGQMPQSMAGFQQQQQQQRQQASADYVAPHANVAPAAQTSYGLTPQQQQMQLQSEQANPWDYHARHFGGDPNTANAASHQRTSLDFTGQQVSDVTHKKDIVPAGGEAAPWYSSWGAMAHAIGGGDATDRYGGAKNRDPNNPSQMASPYASIGAASNGAHGGDSSRLAQLAALNSAQPAAEAPQPSPSFGASPQAPDTWGSGDPGPAPAPWLTEYMQQQQGTQVSDVHSKTAIHSLSAQNSELRKQLDALSGAPPSQEMLNQAGADQAAYVQRTANKSPIQYPKPQAPPSMTMLNQAAADQDQGGHIFYPQTSTSGAPTQDMLNQAAVDQYGPPEDQSRRVASDVHSKSRIQQLEGQLAALSGGKSAMPSPQAPDTGALDQAYAREGGTPNPAQPAIDLRPATGYSYEYKDPAAHGQGRFFGPMAQDLEKTPAGASTVKQAPDGTKMVDTSRLSLVNTAAISDLQKQLAALRGGGGAYPQPQAPDYGKIDLYRGMQRGGTY